MNWLDAQTLIDMVGSYAVAAAALIIFIETAFILTSFLPGDSLLLLLGISLAAVTDPVIPFPAAVALLAVAAITGSQVGFYVGRKIGPPLFERRHTWIFNPAVVAKTHALFDKYGPAAIILARFVPIVRALVPMAAGISHVSPRVFLRYNIVGGLLWTVGVTCAGYFLGDIPFVRDHLEEILLGFVVLSVVPILAELARHGIKAARGNARLDGDDA